jgi:ClpX C4-type zinc finger
MTATVERCIFCLRQKIEVQMLAAIEETAICGDCVAEAAEALAEAKEEHRSKPRTAPIMMSASGFSGDFCGNCGSSRMIRTGTCVTCADCGTNSGCS